MTAVEVCLICDIAECRHIRERKAKMTHPTEAELEEMARDLYHTGELSMPYRRQISDAITALRTQLDEVRAERAFTVSDGQRMLRKQDIITVCDTPDLCFESDDGVGRCGPCAKKLAERDGITLNQYTVSNPTAMRLRRELAAANARSDRAEAALAAQIDHASIKPIASAPEDIAVLVAPENASADDWQVSWWMTTEGRWANWNRSIPPCEWAPMPNRNQPHDRTALDRMMQAEREKALRDLAEVIRGWRNDVPMTGEECANAILAMIEQPKETK